KFLTKMYRTNPDFDFTVTRDFVRNCQTPVLILPDDIPAHPYAIAMEAAMLAPRAEVSMFPWKEPKERIPLAVRQIRSFLRAHRPASVWAARPVLSPCCALFRLVMLNKGSTPSWPGSSRPLRFIPALCFDPQEPATAARVSFKSTF